MMFKGDTNMAITLTSFPKWNSSLATTAYNLSSCSDRLKNNSIKYIVVHYTSTNAPAENNCKYFRGGNRGASADFFVNKDGSIWKYNKYLKKYYSWHCGDGHGAYGISNANSIGIEVINAGGAFTDEQIIALRGLIAKLRYTFKKNLTLVRHFDASKKSCPEYYVNSTRWNALKKRIDMTYKTQSEVWVRKTAKNVSTNHVKKLSKGTEICIVKTKKSGKYTYGLLADRSGWVCLNNTNWN